jgi:hypothetical protein
VSDSSNDPLSSLLSSFALGPAWARAAGDKSDQKSKSHAAGNDRPPRRDDRDRGPRTDGSAPKDREGSPRRPFQGREKYEDRRNFQTQQEEIAPEPGVRVTITPAPQAVHLIGKEVHQVARVYALYDVAKILLADKTRCRAVFEAPEPHAPLIRGKLEDSVFLTRDEAIRHLWNSPLKASFIEEETIEVDPPTGNFQAIARCGISGEWLGPVNFHSYQTNLRRLHREKFARMPFEIYSAKVRTERGEEAVNAWLQTMTRKTRWRLVGDGDDAWINDRAEAERALGSRCFDQAFEETRLADVSGAISAQNLSPSLLVSLKLSGSHARKHPAILIPAVCRSVEAEHLPVFKRQGKLYTGPARPHPLPADAVLAERPGIMVTWIRENKPAKLEGLWKAVLPEGSTAPPADYAADLFWLLHQGHILLYTDDTLVVQETRDPSNAPAAPSGEAKKKKKKKSKKPKSDDNTPTPTSADETAAQVTASDGTAADEGNEDSPPAPLSETPADAPEEKTATIPSETHATPTTETREEVIPNASPEPLTEFPDSKPPAVEDQHPVEEYPGPPSENSANPEQTEPEKPESNG